MEGGFVEVAEFFLVQPARTPALPESTHDAGRNARVPKGERLNAVRRSRRDLPYLLTHTGETQNAGGDFLRSTPRS